MSLVSEALSRIPLNFIGGKTFPSSQSPQYSETSFVPPTFLEAILQKNLQPTTVTRGRVVDTLGIRINSAGTAVILRMGNRT